MQTYYIIPLWLEWKVHLQSFLFNFFLVDLYNVTFLSLFGMFQNLSLDLKELPEFE